MADIERKNLEEAINEYGTIIWNGKGQSMEPLIRERVDYVIIEKPNREIRPYDVVLYIRGRAGDDSSDSTGDYVLHRVLKRDGDDFIILGDNCVNLERVPKDNILGIMTEIKRNGRDYNLNSAGHKLYMNLWVKPYMIRKEITRAHFIAKAAGRKLIKGIKRIGK